MFVVKMAAFVCHLTGTFVRLQSVLLIFILSVCTFVPWLFVDGFVGTADVGMQSFETDFQTFRVKYRSPLSALNTAAPPEPMDPICQALINNFTESSVLYTRCIIQNAKTYKRCQRCVSNFLAVDTSYRLLRQEHNNSTPKRCTEIYPGMDEVNVFPSVFKFVQDSWNAGGCQNCFSWFNINATDVGKLTPSAQTFLNMSEIFLFCIFNESIVYKLQQNDVSTDLLLSDATNDSNVTICTRCKEPYKALNDFYVDNFETMFDKDAIICIDISDLGLKCGRTVMDGVHALVLKSERHPATYWPAQTRKMNFTRYMWQELYKCPIQYASAWPVIVASVVLCCLPVGFYVISTICGHDVERKMVHQKRLRRRSGSSSGVHISTSSDFGSHLTM